MSLPLRCVVDTSVCIKQFISDPLSAKVDQLFTHLTVPQTQFFVPDLLYIECANTLLKYIRAECYSASDAQVDLASLRALSLSVIPTAELMEEAITIGLAHSISAYDACYVALSNQASAPLLTQDGKLVRALASTAYEVYLLNDFSIPPVPLP